MDRKIKRKHSAEFKVRVVSDLLKQEDTLSAICSRYQIHPTQARRWKEQALLHLKQSFSGASSAAVMQEKDKLIEDLYTQVGKLQYQLDWLKKKMGVAF
jgi:transposase-like protein